MNTLKSLVAMQLKDKMDFSKYNYQKGKYNKKLLFDILFSIIKFAAITVVIYFAFYFLSFLRLVDLNSGIPDKFLLIVFTLMFILSIIVATISLMNALYFSNDNTLLLTFPADKETLFLSKMIVFFVYEFFRNIYFILPLLLAFGIINSYSIGFFVFCLFATVFYTLLVVAISGLLSIPAMLINMLLKNYRVLNIIAITLFVAACIVAIVLLIGLIPEDLDFVSTWGTTFWEIQDFMDRFAQIFLPIQWVLYAFVGERYGVIHYFFNSTQIFCLLGVIGAAALILALCFVLVKPLFFKMASKPFEYKKNTNTKQKKNTPKNSFLSSVYKEFLIFCRTPEKFQSLALIAIGLPLSILLLNTIFNAMATRLTGTYMTICFNILIILLVMLSSNAVIAKAYSEEGNSAYLNKTNPQAYYKSLAAKLVINAVTMTISLAVTMMIYSRFANLTFVNPYLLFVALLAFYLGHLFWSAEFDIVNPQNRQYATTGTHYNNPNETKSTLWAFIIAAGTAVVTFLLIAENYTIFWTKLALFALAFMALRTWFYFEKVRLYYKEK